MGRIACDDDEGLAISGVLLYCEPVRERDLDEPVLIHCDPVDDDAPTVLICFFLGNPSIRKLLGTFPGTIPFSSG